MGRNRKRGASAAAWGASGELGGTRGREAGSSPHTVADPFYPGLRDFLQTPRGREVALHELSQMLDVARAAQRAYDASYGEGARVLYGSAHEWGAALIATRKQPPRDLRSHVLELVKTIRDTVTRVQHGLRDANADGLSRLELVRESIVQAQMALHELTRVVDATLMHESKAQADLDEPERTVLQSGVIDLDAHR